jgi:V8-like Glu-specific endopeptidase
MELKIVDDAKKLVDKIRTHFSTRVSYEVLGLESADSVYANIEAGLEEMPEVGLQVIDKTLLKLSDSGNKLSNIEMLGLEAVILLAQRPAINVTQYGLFKVPEYWRILQSKAFWENNRGQCNSYASGKVQFPGLGGINQAGTAILISEDIVLTNRHVVVEIEIAIEGKIKPSSNITIDFGSFYKVQQEWVAGVLECIYKSEKFDVACLKIEGIEKLPKIQPVCIENSETDLTKREIYAVGYPFSSGDEDVEILANIFGFERGTKRLSPGNITNFSGVNLSHDCSTLKGSSGSGLFCLESGNLIGIHYAGSKRKENLGVQVHKILAQFPSDIGKKLIVA